MTTPRLTVGIPSHGRLGLLPRAIDSALAQTVACRIVVAEDADFGATAALIQDRYPDRGIVVFASGAPTLWANWVACARACETEFFLWLQDDDYLRKPVADRVIAGFDTFPRADIWMARNQIAVDERHGYWQRGNGPHVPLDFAEGIPYAFDAEIFAPTSYFTSWALSPAVAFRREPLGKALDGIPDCDLFAERLILVAMAQRGGWCIADPIIAGLWIQHADNTSRKHHADQPRQSRILIEFLDHELDRLADHWPPLFAEWARKVPPEWVLGWMSDLAYLQAEGRASRHGAALRRALMKSLEGRIEIRPMDSPWWRRAFNRLWRRAVL
jgi:hypothetical protein